MSGLGKIFDFAEKFPPSLEGKIFDFAEINLIKIN